MVRGVPLKTDPPEMADRLKATQGLEAALKRVKDELTQARRARSRQRYAYWAAVGAALDSSESISPISRALAPEARAS